MNQSPEPVSASSDPGATRTSSAGTGSSHAFGHYRMFRRLGEGGMGEVWLAEQLQPVHRQVAIKVIKAGMDSAQVIARFEAERQALALMDHPAIAKVFDGGTTPEGRPYFAMEYVKGDPITAYCDRQRLSIPERLELFIHVCDGVQHAHQKGIIHRDLKPSNVLVTVQADHPVPRIIDFGVAKAMAQPLTDRSLFTELGAFIGTPEYMSPEQANLSSLDIDTRSDVYALGLLLYEMLVGNLPFDRDTMHAAGLDDIRRMIREDEAPRPSTRVAASAPATTETAANRRTEPARLTRQLRGDLDWITLKALEKDRTRRYETASALALDVRRHLDHEPVSAGPPSPTYRMGKFIRRHRFGVGAGATLAVLLVAFSVTTAVQAQRISHERDRANREAVAAKQVSDFLVGLFKVSDPSETRGNTLTARELLARGAGQLDQNLKGQPEIQAKLQATIGSVYMGLGLYPDAETQLQQALATETRLLGGDHSETVATSHQLANVFWYRGKLKEAEALYEAVIARHRRSLGADHPDTLSAQFDLASVYLVQKRWDEAERLGVSVLTSQRRILGSEHPDTVSSLSNLQALYFAEGRYADAEPLALEVLAHRRRFAGEQHPKTLQALHNLATVYDARGRYADAERLYLEALNAKRRVLGESHPETSPTERALGSMYVKQQRYEEGEALLLAAYGSSEEGLGPLHPSTQLVARKLVALYEGWGKADKVREWRGKLR
ncbi:MAG: serine/threonine-protein kinase [Vicinamibacterales bacterium]